MAQPRIWARKVFTHMITNHDDDSHCHDYDTMIITDSMVISDIFILVQFKILIQNLKNTNIYRKDFHYDNCFSAMLTLFAVQTSEGWVA